MGSAEVMLVVYFVVFILLAVLAARFAMKSSNEAGVAAVEPDPPEAAGGARRNRLAQLRQRHAAGGGDDDEAEIAPKKIGKKKLEKLEAKEEKRAQRQAEEAMRERKKEQEEEREKLKQEQQEEKERERREKEEEEEKQRQLIAQKEQEEFDKWKDMFSVEQGGSTTLEEEQESQGLLQEFIDYISERKVVHLEDLGSHFGLRAQDVVNRVTSLESMGRITGVLDDRGKFIFITPAEMEAVAKFINLRGRISLADIASESNRLIDLKGGDVPPPQPQLAA